MYKCKECGTEYKEKPDYCDCGNDEFEGVNIGVGVNIATGALKEPITNEIKQETPIQTQEVYEQPKAQPASSMNFHNTTQAAYIPPRTLSVDPMSLIIFIVCVLLSLYVVFFAWNERINTEDSENANADTKQQTVDTSKIPSVDKFWNNALPVVVKKEKEPKVEEKVENIIKQIIPVQTQTKTVTTPKTTTSTKQKVTTVPIKKTTQTTQTKNTAKNTTTKTTTKQQSNTNAQEQAKKVAEDAAKRKAEAERNAAEVEQLKKLQAEQAKKAAEEKARQAAAAKQEFTNYKAQLRNTIGRKIDFTRVIGDGSCIVAFKIDQNGKLVNRSFSKQSSNNTLNDAVYAAVMATPSFNPPPSGYNNETLYLNIKFSNGNFEISLP